MKDTVLNAGNTEINEIDLDLSCSLSLEEDNLSLQQGEKKIF